jgi:hypothetical protein
MPEERDIEKKLRAAAEQRRRAASEEFELHPATRRVWQGEVARLHPAARPAARRFWPRLAWGVSLLAMLGVGVWSFVRPTEPRATAPLPIAAKPALLKESVVNEIVVVEAEAKQATVAAAAPPVSAGRASRDADFAATKGEVSAPEPATDAAAFGLAYTTLPARQELPQQNVRQSFNFSNANGGRSNQKSEVVARVAAKKTSDPAVANLVLNNFQLEQSGNQVRIVDGDGSIYTGARLAEADKLTDDKKPATKTVLPGSVAASKVDALAGNAATLPPSFRFAASGTNVSLRQRVLVNAEFFAVTTNAVPGLMQNANGISEQQFKSKFQNSQRASGNRLVGRAVTADGQAVEVDAEEVAPR